MEQLLVNMYKYMPDFKRILDTSAPGDMDMLCEQYPNFYRFAKLMEQFAAAIATGNFDHAYPDDAQGGGSFCRYPPRGCSYVPWYSPG